MRETCGDPAFAPRLGTRSPVIQLWRRIAPLLLFLLLALSLAAQAGRGAGTGPGGGSGGGGESGSSGSAGPLAVTTIGERSNGITVVGRLEPEVRIEHQIPSAGYVDTILVQEGDTVAAGAQLLQIRRRDDLLELYQPVPLNARISGRIAEIHVSPESEVSAGSPAVTIIGTERFRLDAAVSDKDAFRVQIGQRVTGRTIDGGTISGTLRSRSQEPDYETGLFDLTFSFPRRGEVRIGEFILIELPVDTVQGVFVPRDAVVRRYGSFFVWVIAPDNTLVPQEVSVGPSFGDEVVILDGLDDGVSYLRTLTGREREGQPVPAADDRTR